ncbi:ferrochelatase, mitochondrial-like [Bolinopsis microptera]|uniref:ferrochelatase, mitochondrial-like n=1 Tax=Bolinopsis microptera TaxID=2820187 RepID=UPI00307920C9
MLKNITRSYSTARPRVGILMLNLGGPETSAAVHPFLLRLFSDRDLIPLPFLQGGKTNLLPRFIAKRRTPKIIEQYNKIGGGSPIKMWTEEQGNAMVERVSELCPELDVKNYTGFRYAEPLTEDAMDQMEADGIEHCVAFTQYPQYSCSTSGSSFNGMYRHIIKRQKEGKPMNMTFSAIDRWATHPLLVKSFAELINKQLDEVDPKDRHKVVLLFSAHSLPMSVVNRGDPYPQEVAATVEHVMKALNYSNPYRLVWQSKVGPSEWLGVPTDDAIKGLIKNGNKHLMMVPIAFTSDHIETLYEMDIEYGEDMRNEFPDANIMRCESLNMHSTFIECLTELVADHLKSDGMTIPQMALRCPMCVNPTCGPMRGFFSSRKLPQSIVECCKSEEEGPIKSFG